MLNKLQALSEEKRDIFLNFVLQDIGSECSIVGEEEHEEFLKLLTQILKSKDNTARKLISFLLGEKDFESYFDKCQPMIEDIIGDINEEPEK